MKTFQYTLNGQQLTIRLNEQANTIADIRVDGEHPAVTEAEMPAYAAAIAALYFVVGADMGAAWYLLAWSVLTAALAVLLRRWLRRSGSRLLGRLA